MRETRTERCASELVGAQVAINRAVFELNIREESHPPGRGRAPRDEYTLRCVLDAIEDLAKAASFIQGQRGNESRKARKAVA